MNVIALNNSILKQVFICTLSKTVSHEIAREKKVTVLTQPYESQVNQHHGSRLKLSNSVSVLQFESAMILQCCFNMLE